MTTSNRIWELGDGGFDANHPWAGSQERSPY
jgi:hypothetical protein